MHPAARDPATTAPAVGLRAPVVRASATMLASTTAIFAFGLVLGLVLVGRTGNGPITGWDRQVETWTVRHRFTLVGVSKMVAFLGDAPMLVAITAILTIVLLFVVRSVRALVPLVACLGGELQVFLIRAIVHRHRPPTAVFPAAGSVPGVHEASFSYPSGHSVAVTAVLFAVLGTAAFAIRRTWPWAVAFIASLFVIDTRLVLGVHWFSDVTVGFILGIAWGVTVAVVARRVEWTDIRSWFGRRGRRRAHHPSSAPS